MKVSSLLASISGTCLAIICIIAIEATSSNASRSRPFRVIFTPNAQVLEDETTETMRRYPKADRKLCQKMAEAAIAEKANLYMRIFGLRGEIAIISSGE